MKLKNLFIVVLMFGGLLACNTNNEQKAEERRLDSIRKADSIALLLEQQRLIDSINTVSLEQQAIADSIQNLVNNQ